jgi:competence protein ComEC
LGIDNRTPLFYYRPDAFGALLPRMTVLSLFSRLIFPCLGTMNRQPIDTRARACFPGAGVMVTDTQRTSDKEERTFLRPLIPATLGTMAGIGTGIYLPGHFWPAAALVLATAAGMGWYIRGGCPLLFLPLLLCVGAGYLSIQPWVRSDLPPAHVGRYTDQGKWQVAGTVVDQPQMRDGWLRFTMETRRLVQGDRRVEARGKIRVTARGAHPDMGRGDRVLVSGRLRAVRGFCNFGGFDYERYMALQGLHARLYVQAGQIRREEAGDPGWMARLDRIRGDLGRRMNAALRDHPPEVANLLKALTLGEREAIGAELRERFQRVGVSHVLAISGLHIGMVAAAAFALFYRLLAWVPLLLRNLLVRKGAALLTLLPVAGYAVLAGLAPSTQRALLMVTVLLATFWVGRTHNWLNLLAAAALVILLVFPPALTLVSFQLSFAAVLVIIMGMQAAPLPAPGPSSTLRRKVALRIIALMWVSALAVLGTMPLVMHHFNQVSWVGPLTNLVVVPLVGFVVVPAGLLGIVCAPLSTALSGLLWQIAALGLHSGIRFIEWVAQYPFIAATTVAPSMLEMGLFYLLLGVCLNWKRRTLRIAGLAVVLAAGGADALYWSQRRFGNQRMIVTAVDVGQGSANLLRLPGGFTVLVDGGGFSDNAYFDVGRQVLAPLLWREKIKTIDLVILTHPDSDHLNGLLYVLRQFRVREIWSNHEVADSLGYRQWSQTIRDRGIVHVPFEQLERRSVRSGVTFEVLAPPVDFLRRGVTETWRDTNNNSLVVRVIWQGTALLFTGDVGAPAEAQLVEQHGTEGLRSTILLVPHHGSGSSGTAPFLQAVQPAEGIIPVGWQNRFRFPHDGVIERLSAENIRIWRTDHCGAVRVVVDAEGYQMRACRSGCP